MSLERNRITPRFEVGREAEGFEATNETSGCWIPCSGAAHTLPPSPDFIRSGSPTAMFQLSTKSLRLFEFIVMLWSLCLGCACATSLGGAELDAKKRITVKEARALVNEIFRHDDPRHEVGLEPFEMPDSPEFYGFEALRANPGGSDHITSYLVNSRTGDVWDVDGCRLVETPTLKRLQEKTCKRLEFSHAELAKALSLKPFCYEGP